MAPSQLPFIGSVPLEGLSVHEAQDRIADRLRAGRHVLRAPEVILQVLDTVNGSVLITGEVRAVVPVSTERPPSDRRNRCSRRPALQREPYGQDRAPRSGDSADPIVVDLGTDLASSTAANTPARPPARHHPGLARERRLRHRRLQEPGSGPRWIRPQPLTLLQLASLSGGINFEGRYNDLRLIRTVTADGKTERKVVNLDIKKIRDGKADDPILQANDIVFLPTNSDEGRDQESRATGASSESSPSSSPLTG